MGPKQPGPYRSVRGSVIFTRRGPSRSPTWPGTIPAQPPEVEEGQRTLASAGRRGETPVPTGGEGTEELEGVYIISVAARILEMHPQTLRKYERIGLLTPSRTLGMLRLYSEEDIARLRLIKHLVGDLRLNLAGVQLALELFNQLLYMRSHLSDLQGKALKSYLEESLEEMLELLHNR